MIFDIISRAFFFTFFTLALQRQDLRIWYPTENLNLKICLWPSPAIFLKNIAIHRQDGTFQVLQIVYFCFRELEGTHFMVSGPVSLMSKDNSEAVSCTFRVKDLSGKQLHVARAPDLFLFKKKKITAPHFPSLCCSRGKIMISVFRSHAEL